MGGIYIRGQKLWFWYIDANGERQWEPSGLPVGDEAKARRTLEVIERRVEAEVLTGIPSGDLTVKAYGEKWLANRRVQGLESIADDETRLRRHAWPEIGHHLLKETRTRHIRDLVRSLRTKQSALGTPLAPRTIRNIYGALHTMFHDAVVDELLSTNPCVLKRNELPGKVDKDPAWRPSAVYSREEVERLISDSSVPEERRTLYGLLFLCGMRIGEVSALQWRDYDAAREPLGCLTVSKSYSRKKKKVKGLKGRNDDPPPPREVPVDPTLAKILASWKVGGFERYAGKKPGLEDLLLPSGSGAHLKDNTAHANLLQDLKVLGLRARRTHDTRRTLIPLALADGARKDILKRITHKATGDVMDLYTTLPWEASCAEISKLRIKVLEGQIVELRQVVGMKCDSECDSETPEMKKPPSLMDLEAGKRVPRAGFEPENQGSSSSGSSKKRVESRLVAVPEIGPETGPPTVPVTIVTGVAGVLAEAASDWEASHDTDRLRARLLAILATLPSRGDR